MDERREGLSAGLDDLLALDGLGKDGDDGDTRVATDDGDVGVLGEGAGDAGEEGGGADGVEGLRGAGAFQISWGLLLAFEEGAYGDTKEAVGKGVWR